MLNTLVKWIHGHIYIPHQTPLNSIYVMICPKWTSFVLCQYLNNVEIITKAHKHIFSLTKIDSLRWYFTKRGRKFVFAQTFLDDSPTFLVVRSRPEISLFLFFSFYKRILVNQKFQMLAIFAHCTTSSA